LGLLPQPATLASPAGPSPGPLTRALAQNPTRGTPWMSLARGPTRQTLLYGAVFFPFNRSRFRCRYARCSRLRACVFLGPVTISRPAGSPGLRHLRARDQVWGAALLLSTCIADDRCNHRCRSAELGTEIDLCAVSSSALIGVSSPTRMDSP
jgi:hypothetical protein